jgi:hypothetical protein
MRLEGVVVDLRNSTSSNGLIMNITFRSLKKIEFKNVKKYWDMITCFNEQLFCHGVRRENLPQYPTYIAPYSL